MLFLKVLKLCPHNLQKKFWLLLAAMLLLAFGETAVVGLIAFYAASVSDPQASWQAVMTSSVFQSLPDNTRLIVDSPRALIGVLSLLVIMAVVFKNIYRGYVTFHIARFAALIEAFFGQRLMEIFLHRDYLWHLKSNSADLLQLIQWRTHLGNGFVTPHLKIFCEISMLIVLLASLLVVQPLVSLLFLVVQGGAGVAVYFRLKKGLDYSARNCKKLTMEMNRDATRAIHGIKDVQITGTADFFVTSFKKSADKYADMFGLQQFWKESPLLSLESFGFVILAGVILFMLFVLGYSPLETTGTAALLAVTAWRLLPAFNRIVSSMTGIRTAQVYVETLLKELYDNKLNIIQKDRVDCEKQLFKKVIEFQNVSFSYDDARPVLFSMNLKIPCGQSIGIMGPSGCGKSTLVDLLTGLLRPQQGKILIDGQELTNENVFLWRSCIGYVPQFPYIFEGTLAENVAFGKDHQDIDMELVLESCRLAAMDFIHQLPQGVETVIGERGVRLSGGQRQRVAIARALYRRPQLIVFDEATSALDEENDQHIRKLIAGLKGEKTLIVVSHRNSTVQDCDYILKLNGNNVEQMT